MASPLFVHYIWSLNCSARQQVVYLYKYTYGYTCTEIWPVQQELADFWYVCTTLCSNINFWVTSIWSVLAAKGCRADLCILTGRGHLLSEYISATGEIPVSTLLVWMWGSVRFFHSKNKEQRILPDIGEYMGLFTSFPKKQLGAWTANYQTQALSGKGGVPFTSPI